MRDRATNAWVELRSNARQLLFYTNKILEAPVLIGSQGNSIFKTENLETTCPP